MAFTNGSVGNHAIRGLVPPFLWRETLQMKQTEFLLFYRPLASIMKTCGNEDVPLKVPPGN